MGRGTWVEFVFAYAKSKQPPMCSVLVWGMSNECRSYNKITIKQIGGFHGYIGYVEKYLWIF